MAGQSGGGGTRDKYAKEKKAALAKSLVDAAKGNAKQGEALKTERARNEAAHPGKYQPKQPSHVGIGKFDPNATNRLNTAIDVSMKREGSNPNRGIGKPNPYSYINPKNKVQQSPS